MKKIVKGLKYILFFIGVSLVLTFITSSCITEKKRSEICATCPVIIKDSIQTQYMPFDTTLFINSYGKDIALSYSGAYTDMAKQLQMLFDQYNDTIITLKNGIKSSIIKTPRQIIFRCQADSLKYLLKIERAKKTTVRTIVKQVKKPCPECDRVHRSGFDNFLRWFFWIIIILIAIKNLPGFIKALIHNIKNFR